MSLSGSLLTGLALHCDADVGRFDSVAGGSPVTADAAQVLRWEDRSGNARHLTQPTSANRPIFDAVRGLVVSCGGPNGPNQWFTPTAFTFDRQDFTLALILEQTTQRRGMNGGITSQHHFYLQAVSDTCNLHYDGTGSSANCGKLAAFNSTFKVSSTVPISGSRVLVAFVGTAAALTTWANAASSTATALTAGTSTPSAFFGATGASVFPLQAGVKDLLFWSRALSGPEMADLLSYARTRGVAPTAAGLLAIDGDSQSAGYGVNLHRSWWRLLALPSGVRRHCAAESGAQQATLTAQAAAILDPRRVPGAPNVLALFAGTNDVAAGTTAATLWANLQTYAAARRSAGWKVACFTIPNRGGFNAGQNAVKDSVNASIRTNPALFDGLVDVQADPRLATPAYDGTHFNDAQHAVIAELAQPVISALFPVAAPRPRFVPRRTGRRPRLFGR